MSEPPRPRRPSFRRGWGTLWTVVVAGCLAGCWGLTVGARATDAMAAAFYVEATADPPEGEIPLSVAFNATPTEGIATGYAWEFGDGSYLNGTSPSDANPVHTYTTAGTFVVDVTLWEANGSASTQISVDAYVGPFAVAIHAVPASGVAPLAVLFTTNVSGGSGTYVGFSWTFGDGGKGTGPEVADTYRAPGTYLVRVTVNDSEGLSASAVFRVVVEGAGAPDPGGLQPPEVLAVLFAASGAVGVTTVMALTWRGRRGPGGPSRTGTEAPPMVPEAPPEVRTIPIPPAPVDVPPPGTAEVPEPAALSEDAAGSGLSPTYVAEGRRISHQIILRLASLGHRNPEDIPDGRWTQQGLGLDLGVAQSRVSNVLRRLEAVGVVEMEIRHVVGRPRRVKVYQLTPRGESLARTYRIEPRPGSYRPDPARADRTRPSTTTR